MRYKAPYANGYAKFETEAPCVVAQCICQGGHDSVLSHALESPISGPGFSEFARSSGRLLFILCDGTRPTPTAAVLERLHRDISGHVDVGFIVATGTHRQPTGGELRRIFGRHYDEFLPKTAIHDSRDPDANTYIGTTSRGTPVRFSRKVMEADGIVVINSVEPHYFAGYTGGRKSFLPGIAGYDSIEANHSHAAEPGAMPLSLAGNPVSEDMFEALDMMGEKRIFSIQTVMTPDERIYAAFSGDIRSTFLRAVDKANEIYSVEVSGTANIVITVAPPPMDMDLYQSQKALEHGRIALEPGGIIILVSSCWDGIGDTGFYRQLMNWKEGTPTDDIMGSNYRLGNHKVIRLLNLLDMGEIYAVTELDESVLSHARMRGFNSLQEAVDAAIEKLECSGISPRIILLPGGSLTVPKVVSA